MANRALLVFSLVTSCLCTTVTAQSPCSTTSFTQKSICLIPQIFGYGGLGSPPLFEAGSRGTDFQNSALTSFAPLNSAIGSQLALLPFASPASGFVYSISAGVPVQTQQSFGPILAERAETIGRHKLFVGVSYQYFAFGSIDGVGLKNIPAVFTTTDAPAPYNRDVVQTNTRIDLKIHQVTGVATFGLTNRIDVAVAVPLDTVNTAVTTSANIIENSVQPGDTNPADYRHLFAGPCDYRLTPYCLITSETFHDQRNVTGIGDVTFRIKGTVWPGEKLAVAVAADFRAPTGDAEDFLGSGTFGFTPFVVASYKGRVSPHINLGFQVNGNSVLAPPTASGTNGHLPNNFFYTVGADWGATRHLTFDLDFLGQEVINGPQLAVTQYQDQGNLYVPNSQQTFANIAQSRGTFAVNNLSAGLKWDIAKELVFTGNVIYQVNNGGLRARVVPLAGLSYTF